MVKTDFKKELKGLYSNPAGKISFVDVPPMNFLCLDGKGNPNTSDDYQAAVEALFTVSYQVKFSIKKGPLKFDYGVMPLEGLWWVEDMREFDINKKENWLWTMMIMQPDVVTKELIDESIGQAMKKKDNPALSRLRFEQIQEGKCAQVLHTGPFSEEGPVIQKLHESIENAGFSLSGKHHEIYLSDIRKAAPAKWKTIIRQPYR